MREWGESRVRIIATSRAVEYAEEIREESCPIRLFLGFSVLRWVTMSELRERCRLLAIWVCRGVESGSN